MKTDSLVGRQDLPCSFRNLGFAVFFLVVPRTIIMWLITANELFGGFIFLKKLSIIYITSSPVEYMQIGVQNLTKAYWISPDLYVDKISCSQQKYILSW